MTIHNLIKVKQNVAIVIMGGGVTELGDLPLFVQKRCDKAIIESYEYEKDNLFIIASSSFSLNTPAKRTDNYILSESTAISKYIKSKINISNFNYTLLCEQFSHDTLGSLFFIDYIYRTNFEIHNLIFVTSSFHAKRVRGILSRMKEIGFYKNCLFTVVESEDTFDRKFIKSRLEHEEKALIEFNKIFKKISSKKEFIRYMLINHTCMNCTFSGRKVCCEDLY